MAVDPWLPVGFVLPTGGAVRRALSEGPDWQLFDTRPDGRALVADHGLATKWVTAGLLEDGHFHRFSAGGRELAALVSDASQTLEPVWLSRSPNTKDEALAFALALKSTRDANRDAPLQDSIYVERFNRLLPTFSISPKLDDDVVLGTWLTGGARVSARSYRRLEQILSWLRPQQLQEVLAAGGFASGSSVAEDHTTQAPDRPTHQGHDAEAPVAARLFSLPGRPELERFFNEFVIDIVSNRERYKTLGIDFPSAIVLHGPPGCGKTFAVERLVDFLGWPRFEIEASSVASPYIHETSRKVSDVFESAIKAAPSVLIIDEMEAFLADRQMGTGHHRVEEVGEFLRRIPEASRKGVLVVAMTNRIEMIDSAILRRGRFDHIVSVGFATEPEILALLDKLLAAIPVEDAIDAASYATRLSGRPLSDVAFVVREGARLAAKRGLSRLDNASLEAAMESTSPRGGDDSAGRRIGF